MLLKRLKDSVVYGNIESAKLQSISSYVRHLGCKLLFGLLKIICTVTKTTPVLANVLVDKIDSLFIKLVQRILLLSKTGIS